MASRSSGLAYASNFNASGVPAQTADSIPLSLITTGCGFAWLARRSHEIDSRLIRMLGQLADSVWGRSMNTAGRSCPMDARRGLIARLMPASLGAVSH
jgi:hypothetical protein